MSAQNWIARSVQALSPADEAALLTEILETSKEQAPALGELAEARQCRSLFRRAALDQYAKYEGPGAELFLETLTDYRREPDEDIRLIAFQWLVELIAPHGTLVRGAKGLGGWEEHLLNDPSPRVRWLAALIEKPDEESEQP